MTNPTSNFGWQMPTSTDLVTDLPADFEVFGQAVDTSMADLKGGTTGQILSKATNTDMDFIWITNDQGDITAVNTTAPLQGGATSGAVTLSVDAATTAAAGVVQLTNSVSSTSITTAAVPANVKTAYDLANGAIPKTLTTTTGDTIYASSANTPARLPIGSTGQILTVSGGVPTWATPAGGGKIAQVVSATISTATATSSTSYVDATNFNLSITPTNANSKILVMIMACMGGYYSGDNSGQWELQLVRGSTSILAPNRNNWWETDGVASRLFRTTVPVTYLDSPATTSSTNYKIQIRNQFGGSVYVNQNSNISTITLMEVLP